MSLQGGCAVFHISLAYYYRLSSIGKNYREGVFGLQLFDCELFAESQAWTE